ncbi:MAG: hypothetical protein HDQ99_16840 [Lachnospiraceae bacterium]|nr:hypothetical protein [Lachnospiraceae bacterium]
MNTSLNQTPNYKKHCILFATLSSLALLAVAMLNYITYPQFKREVRL